MNTSSETVVTTTNIIVERPSTTQPNSKTRWLAADEPDPPDLEVDFLGPPLSDVDCEQQPDGVDPVDRHRPDGELGALILHPLAEEDDQQKSPNGRTREPDAIRIHGCILRCQARSRDARRGRTCSTYHVTLIQLTISSGRSRRRWPWPDSERSEGRWRDRYRLRRRRR